MLCSNSSPQNTQQGMEETPTPPCFIPADTKNPAGGKTRPLSPSERDLCHLETPGPMARGVSRQVAGDWGVSGKRGFGKATRHCGMRISISGGERPLFRGDIPTWPAPAPWDVWPPLGSWGSLGFHPGATLENQGRLRALPGREELRPPVPGLAVNDNYLWSTLDSPQVLEQQHSQIHPR